jgi:transcriptional regulator with XRE-family HTH domain
MTASEYRALREKLGTQEQVARELGVTMNTVARRERGEVTLTREHELALLRLAETRRAPDPRRKRSA